MARAGDRRAREQRDRFRAYDARRTVHHRQGRRRLRDDVIAGVVAVVVIAGAVVAQLAYFGSGPGAKPEAAGSTSTATPSATASPAPTSTPAATDHDTGPVPSRSIAEDRTWTGSMTVGGAALSISLDGKDAPQAVASFVSLTRKGFYDGLTCHRLTTSGIYVLQCGDPDGDGTGGPGYSFGPIENAPTGGVYPTGALALANSGSPYSNGSKFFIVYKDSPLPPDYTVFGHVTAGLDQLQAKVISKGLAAGATNGDGKPARTVRIEDLAVR